MVKIGQLILRDCMHIIKLQYAIHKHTCTFCLDTIKRRSYWNQAWIAKCIYWSWEPETETGKQRARAGGTPVSDYYVYQHNRGTNPVQNTGNV